MNEPEMLSHRFLGLVAPVFVRNFYEESVLEKA